MAMAPEKWFCMRTDFFGRDSNELGLYDLSPKGMGAYVASIAYVCRYGVDSVHRGLFRMFIGERPSAVIRELVELGFLIPTAEPNHFRVAHEGTLWRRGNPNQRRAIPDWIRAAVMSRDDSTCVLCGSQDDPTLDHIWPYSKGGTDTADNLRVLCRPCNSAKGARV